MRKPSAWHSLNIVIPTFDFMNMPLKSIDLKNLCYVAPRIMQGSPLIYFTACALPDCAKEQ